ncbi:MAG: MG2 domain-containing protein [Sandaracinaceae bacterium]
MAVSWNGGGVRAGLLALLLVCVPHAASAQDGGWELAIDGATSVRLGRTARFRGVAYGVRGLAELVAQATRVRARIEQREGPSGAWAEVRSAADGTFAIDVPVPAGLDPSDVYLDVEVGPDGAARRFSMPVHPRPAVGMHLVTDRRLYEPGEPVHVWARLVESVSQRPLAGEAIELVLSGPSMPRVRRVIETGPSGVAHLELAVPDGAPEGSMTVTARVEGQLEASAAFHVGTRTWERVFAEVEVEPEPVAPGAEATVSVAVTATSGAPIRDAFVTLTIERTELTGRTGADGVAHIVARAPVYLEHDTGTIAVRAEIHHPGYGTVNAFGQMRLAVPLSLSIEAVPLHGGLVPEVDDVLLVRLHDGVGDPPAQPVQVSVEGPAVRGGRASATTDANGLVEIPVRLPRGASTTDGSNAQTSVVVTASGPLERLARIYLPVYDEAEVLPTIDRPVADPGTRVEVRVQRRPSVARSGVTLELLDPQGELVGLERMRPGQATAALDLPADRLGIFTVRARAVHADETLEGRGAIARLVVRPASPDFPTVTPARQRWTVGETAHVELATGAGGPRRWAAVLVRDLAAHGGEQPFASYFLGRQLEEALLTPSDPAGARLVFATLAADLAADPEPHAAPPLADALGLPSTQARLRPRGDLRDPWPLARELERRGVARPMRELEERLAAAIDANGLDAITTVAGGRRRFPRRRARERAVGEDPRRHRSLTMLRRRIRASRRDAVAQAWRGWSGCWWRSRLPRPRRHGAAGGADGRRATLEALAPAPRRTQVIRPRSSTTRGAVASRSSRPGARSS